MDMIARFQFKWILLLVLVYLLVGCGNMRAKMTVSSMRPIMDKMNIAVNKNSDVELVKDAMPASLVQMDGFLEADPENEDLLLRAAEANGGYAFLFLMDTDKPRARKLYQKSKEYALRVLLKDSDFKEAFDKSDDEFTKSLQTFDKDDVRALFLAANNWLSWIGLSHADNTKALTDLPKVEAIMNRIVELDDTFNYGCVHAMLGSYLASRPVMLGGNPKEADWHFKQAFEITDSKYLMWKYLYAKFYAVQIQDRELFVKTLQEVISSPENLLPEKNFVNEAARMKSKTLLAEVDEFF
ncbi:MAG: hypothetical protein C0403_15065 [Desulfobacterium sp.]|nr:hypothetical protein [Desulfobacterium sp.]